MIFPTLDLSKEEKAARRKWKYEAPKFAVQSTSRTRINRHKSDSIRWIIIVVCAIFTDLIVSSFIQ